MENNNIRRVHYIATQGAEDLFRCPENGRVYCRQPLEKGEHPLVRWCTTSKWSGGYEADSPLKAGLEMQVTNPAGNDVLFAETIVASEYYCGSVAEKKAPFIDEVYRSTASEIQKKHNLASYEQWKKWLLSDKDVFGYTGCDDNWLFAEVNVVNSVILERVKILGYEYPVIAQGYTHKISGKSWVYCSLAAPWTLGSSTVAICGYQFEDQEEHIHA